MVDWSNYDRWNSAIADVVFSMDNAGVPVYLDLDEDTLDALAAHIHIPRDDAVEVLCAAVTSTLRKGGTQTGLLQPQMARLSQWRRQVSRSTSAPEPPPVLALLAVTVLAAEAMGTGSFAPHAYFPHLFGILGAQTVRERQAVEKSYRRSAEAMWDAVDLWLTRLDGRRGLPSAFALSHRFVGLPMSQALVRAADRSKLTRMFESFGLPPGYAIAPSDMAGLFDQWIKHQPCPVSAGLANLWSKPAARERIAEVVSNELLTWDGSGRAVDVVNGSASPRGLRLLGNLTRGLGRTRLQLTLALRSASDRPISVTADAADGTPISLPFVPGPGGLLRLDHLQTLDLVSVLSGVLTVTAPDDGKFSRHPRQLIPLSFDDAQVAYVETERVQLAQDSMLLVRDVSNRVNEIDALLTEVARPGFTRHGDGTAGIPAGWVLFTGVEILGRPNAALAAKYNELVPLASTQLTLAGGMKLPGRLVKWSSMEPPEIRAISQKAASIRVSLVGRPEDDDATVPIAREFTADGPALTVQTSALRLPDGDYRLSLFEDGSSSPAQQLELRLRSADTVDAWTWFGAKRLWHDFEANGAWAVMSASEARPEGLHWGVDGPFALGSVDLRAGDAAGSQVWWTEARPIAGGKRPALTVLAPDPKSCVVSGAHYLEYPTWFGTAYKGPKFIDGVCKYCGLVRRSPAWAPKAKFGATQSGRSVSINVAAIQPVSAPSEASSWAAALDGLMHLGGGRRSWLERLGLQVNGSQLFVHQFIKAVTALGFIDFSRDSSMQLDEWELVPRYLVELQSGAFAMIGYWPNGVVDAFLEQVHGPGVSRAEIPASGAMTLSTIEGIDAEELQAIAANFEATVVLATTRTMLAALPPISSVGASLTRIPVPGGRTLEQFHLPSASWTATDSLAGMGAFRADAGQGWQYLFRSEEDVHNGSVALGDAYLVKHLAAQQNGRPLLAYKSQRNLIVVPVGADLPGLYERAVVLASGRLPSRFNMQGVEAVKLLGYHDIAAEEAQRLWELMSA